MKKLIALIFLLPFLALAQNVQVLAKPSGTLVTPTNFFRANSNAIISVIGNIGGGATNAVNVIKLGGSTIGQAVTTLDFDPTTFYAVSNSGTIYLTNIGAAGTVTSVGVTSAVSALTVSGSPITGAGNIGLSLNTNLVGWGSIPTNNLVTPAGLYGSNYVSYTQLNGSNFVNTTQLANGTNSIKNYADATFLPLAGGTVSGAVITTDTNALAGGGAADNQFITAGFVRSLLMSGTPQYATTNLATNLYARSVTSSNLALSTIPAYDFTNTYSSVSAGQYVFSLVTTQLFTSLNGAVSVDLWLDESSGGTVTAGPELYYIYRDKTNLYGDWTATARELLPNSLHQWTINPGQTTATNSEGFLLVLFFKVTATTGGTPTFSFRGGTNWQSHFHASIATTTTSGTGTPYYHDSNQFTETVAAGGTNVAIKSGAVVTNLSLQGTITANALTVTNQLTLGGNLAGSGQIRAGGAQPIYWDSRTTMYSTGSGYLTLQNLTGGNTNFYGLAFGGGSSGALDAYHVLLNSTGNVLRVTHGGDLNGTNQAGGIVINPIANTNQIYGTTYINGTNILRAIKNLTNITATIEPDQSISLTASATAGTNALTYLHDSNQFTESGSGSVSNVAIKSGAIVTNISEQGTLTASRIAVTNSANFANATASKIAVFDGSKNLTNGTIAQSDILLLSGGTMTGQLNMGTSGTLLIPQTNASVTAANLSLWYDGADDEGGKKVIVKDGGGDLKTLAYTDDMYSVAAQAPIYLATNGTTLTIYGTNLASTTGSTFTAPNTYVDNVLSPLSAGTNYVVNFSLGEAQHIAVTNHVCWLYATNPPSSGYTKYVECTIANTSGSDYNFTFPATTAGWYPLGTIPTVISNSTYYGLWFKTRGTNVYYGASRN